MAAGKDFKYFYEDEVWRLNRKVPTVGNHKIIVVYFTTTVFTSDTLLKVRYP
jgi:hypothetical protein